MVKKNNELSRDLIIHPGETLREILEDRNMTQNELAARVGRTKSFISKVVNGEKDISVSLAQNLYYVFGVDASFWINLQANYNKELAEFEEMQNITDEEIEIIKKLKDVVSYAIKLRLISDAKDTISQIIEMRKFLSVGNLINIPNFAFNSTFRASTNTNVDIYVLFAWQKICDILAQKNPVARPYDVDKLRNRVEDIKMVMFDPVEEMEANLVSIFADCGVAFNIVKNFRGAPVHGFIKKQDNDSVMLCMTIRGKYADIFWFTLFHEIAHLLHKDYKAARIDFEFTKDAVEERADAFAENALINKDQYKNFVSKKSLDWDAIEKFALQNKVKPYIVLGRLQNDKILGYQAYSDKKVKYKWAN